MGLIPCHTKLQFLSFKGVNMKVEVVKLERRASRSLAYIKMQLLIYPTSSSTTPDVVYTLDRTVNYLDDTDIETKRQEILNEFQRVINRYKAALEKWGDFDQAFEQFCKEIEASLTKYVVCPVAWQIGA